MNAIYRWDPFREMLALRNTMDRLYESALAGAPTTVAGESWSLALDVAENDSAYVVKASVPGINPDDLEITYNENTLTIRGETKADQEFDEGQYHLRERRWGSFTRSVTLPMPVQSGAIQAACDNGILTLTLPKAEESKPKRIQVQSGTKVIAGQTGTSKN